MRHAIKFPDYECLDSYEERIRANIARLGHKYYLESLDYPRGFFIDLLNDTRLGVQLLVQAVVSNESLPAISSNELLNQQILASINAIAKDVALVIYEKRAAYSQGQTLNTFYKLKLDDINKRILKLSSYTKKFNIDLFYYLRSVSRMHSYQYESADQQIQEA